MVAITLDEKIQIIKAFINNGLDIEEISRATDISMSEVAEIIILYCKN